jgi:hypothetical protein
VVKLTEQCKRRGRLAPCLYLGAWANSHAMLVCI